MQPKERTKKPPWKVQISLPKWAGERLLDLQEELEIERRGQVSYGQIVGEALGLLQEQRELERMRQRDLEGQAQANQQPDDPNEGYLLDPETGEVVNG